MWVITCILYIIFPINNVTNVTLSSFKKMPSEKKRDCYASFGLLHPHSLLDTKGVLTASGGGASTEVPGTNPSCWEQICSEFSGVFEPPGTSPERALKHEIRFLPDSAPPAKRCKDLFYTIKKD